VKEKRLIPKKRFEGFIKSWEEKTIEEVVDNLYNGQTPSRANKRYWNGEVNWLSSGELNKGLVTKTIEKITEKGRENANLKIVPKGTFIIAITGLEAAGTRGNCAVLGIDTTLNQSCMAIYPNQQLLDSLFLFQWYMKNGEEYGIKYTQGTKQQSYNATLINKLKINTPIKEEQQKIGEFFKQLDQMITLEQRNLEKTKALKSAYLAEMFPAEGERVPKRRFAKFEDKWILRELGEVANFFNNMRIPIDTKKRIKGNYPYYGATGVIDYVKDYIFEGEYILLAEDGENILSRNNAIAYLTKGRFWVNNHAHVMNMRAGSNLFLLQLLEKQEYKKYNSGTAQPKLNGERVKSMKFYFPSVQEQQAIGEFFKKLDDTITNQQQKLDKLKAMKQAYLQEMFV
jgi:type I restriction enzyme S subunit